MQKQEPLKKEVRDILNRQSKEIFGTSSYWQTFAKKNGMTNEQCAELFSELIVRKPAFDAHIKKLDSLMTENPKLIYVHKTGTLGFIETEFQSQNFIRTINYSTPDMKIKSDPFQGKYEAAWTRLDIYQERLHELQNSLKLS